MSGPPPGEPAEPPPEPAIVQLEADHVEDWAWASGQLAPPLESELRCRFVALPKLQVSVEPEALTLVEHHLPLETTLLRVEPDQLTLVARAHGAALVDAVIEAARLDGGDTLELRTDDGGQATLPCPLGPGWRLRTRRLLPSAEPGCDWDLLRCDHVVALEAPAGGFSL